MEQPATQHVLELRDITKVFPGVVACDHVSMTLDKGEVVALLGENGAGKSTLMNMVYGLLSPDGGQILVDGAEVAIKSPKQAIGLGIGMVHQHFMLVDTLTVAENIVLGHEPVVGPLGVMDVKREHDDVVALSRKYGLKVDPDALVADISVGQQQRAEILKSLYRGARILVLDEPTAVLTPQEVRDLFDVIRSLVADGLSIVLITHKLDEIKSIADRVVVMRDGKVVGDADPKGCSQAELAKMMVGREVVLRVVKTPGEPQGDVLVVSDIEVDDERGLPMVRGASLTVRAGEILAIAGVDGNGQHQLVEAIFGLVKPKAGTISLDGRDITHLGTHHTIEAGVSLVPEDRQRRGLILEFDLAENLILGDQDSAPYSRGGLLDRKKIAEVARTRVDDYDVRTPGIGVLAGNLSGGNQQKLVLARELGRDPKLLIAEQPTRGLDVGAIEFVHNRIIEERDRGKAVLLVSFELEEVLSLADRVVVMYEGRVVHEVQADHATEEELGFYMTGGGRGRPVVSEGGGASDA